MKLTDSTIGLALMVMLGGCSLAPTYERPALPVAATFAGTAPAAASAAKGTSPDARSATATDWQTFLTDPRLKALVDLALRNNRDLRVAVLNVEKTRAQYQVQEAAAMPQLGATTGFTGSRKPASVSTSGKKTYSRVYSAEGSVSWEIDFFGRLRSLSDAAIEQYLATDYARQAAQTLLIAQVADQYLALLAVDEQLALTQATLDATAKAYDIMKLQFDTGTLSELDLQLQQTAVEQARIDYQTQLRLQGQAQTALTVLIGQPLPADLPPARPLDDQGLLTDVPAGLPSDLLTRRPDILQAEATLRAQNANIGAARAAFFPRISLTGAAGSQSATLGSLFGATSAAWSFAPTITLPIFDGGANRANLAVANTQKQIAVAQYEKAIQTAFKEVSDGLLARSSYDEQLAAQRRYTDAQAKRMSLTQMMYDSGSASYLDVLLAHNALYKAQQALITSRLNRLTNLVDLYRALGGGWHPPA